MSLTATLERPVQQQRFHDETDIIPDVPNDLVSDVDRQAAKADWQRLHSTTPDDPLAGYSVKDREALLAHEYAAQRLGVLGVRELPGVVLDTLRAQKRMEGTVVHTPLVEANHFIPGAAVRFLLKNEGLQPVGSYKLRGAYNAIMARQLIGSGREVVADSAGNHGYSVAWICRRLGLTARIFMPKNAPDIKKNAVGSQNAKIVLEGKDYSETAEDCARYLVENPGAAYIPPFDDPDVIGGQRTIAAEIAQDCPEGPDYILVPIGGGGAIAAIASYYKALRPETVIIGVQSEKSAAMTRSLEAGYRVLLDSVDTVADGTKVRQPGKLTFEIAQETVDVCVTVTEDQIYDAIADHDEYGLPGEGAGVLATAGLREYLRTHPDMTGTAVGILSGRNIDPRTVRKSYRRRR